MEEKGFGEEGALVTGQVAYALPIASESLGKNEQMPTQ